MDNFEVQEQRPNGRKRKLGCLIAVIVLIVLMVLSPIVFYFGNLLYQEGMDNKYGGHGFDYMGGWSSTDFTGYHVYDGDKLVELDHPADLTIEGVENMPVLDGAEACYPLYSAIAKTIYKDIDLIELDAQKAYEELPEDDVWDDEDEEIWSWSEYNGRVVSFSNTVKAYYRLVEKEVDLVFGASPSQDQMDFATSEGERIEPIPIGREGFVFFVEEDNPVDSLTSEEVRKIYSGEITNWSEVGGKNQKITAFQRPEESGSQVMMKNFMGETSLMEPDKYTVVGGMGEVIESVKQYHHKRGAIAYTFNYFLTGLQQEKNVKILAIDGVYPNTESIADGSYPLVVNLVCSKLESNDDPYVQEVLDFILSDDGQELVEKTGYAPLKVGK